MKKYFLKKLVNKFFVSGSLKNKEEKNTNEENMPDFPCLIVAHDLFGVTGKH